MSKLRSLSTSFWSDPYIEELTPNQKLLFIYLITNEKTNMLGIYESSIRKMSFETGIEKGEVLKALKRFESDNKVKYQSNYVILVNYMKYQNYNTNMMKSAIDVYNNLPNELKIKGLEVCKSNPKEGFRILCKGFRILPKREREREYELEKEDEIELEKEKTKFDFKKELIDYGFDKNLVSDWLEVRQKKKSTNTKTALNQFLKEVEKSNLDKNEILEICVARSWAGFNLKWIQNEKNGIYNSKENRNGISETRDLINRANAAAAKLFGERG